MGEELAALLDLKRQSVRCWLYELHHLGCLEPVPIEAGKRWHLCELGLRLLAAANHLHICNMASIPEDGSDTEPLRMVQRGEALLVRHIRHLWLLRRSGVGSRTTI